MADPHHTDSSDYQRGTMEISEQVSTWALFMGLSKWCSLVLAAILVWLVVWFCTPAGFLAGFVSGVVLFGAGFVFLKSGSSH